MSATETRLNKALRLGPESNDFSNTNQATTEAERDAYFASNPAKLAIYNNNSSLMIRLTYLVVDTLVTRFQVRMGGAWVDYTPVVQGPPGEVASLAGVQIGEIPYKTLDGTFAGSNMRLLEDGAILAPAGFTVESGSITFGEVLTLSEISGFLGITNHLNDNQYTLVDFKTPTDAASSPPQIFHLLAAEAEFVAQAVDTTNIPDNPLIFNYTVQNTAKTNRLKFRTYSPMSNVRIKISQVSNGVVAKYIPTQQVWEEGFGGLTWILGDNTYNFGDTPLIFNAGNELQVEIRADVVALKGNGTGIPYFTATLQVGQFRQVITSAIYTASDIKSKLETLSSPNKLSKTAIQDAVLSVNSAFGDVVIDKAGVGLGNVDNTSDVNKPVSTAQQTAINLSMTNHLAASDPHPQYTTTAEASAAAPVQSVNLLTGDVVLTTTNISEGGNLYYSDSRVQNYLTASGYNVKSASSIGSGSAVYKQNVINNIEFRSVLGTTPITVTQNTNDITISAPNVPRVYNSAGLVTSPKIWYGTTTVTSGAWTINYSSAGFTAPPEVFPTAHLTTATVVDRAWATMDGTPTTTTASGYALRGRNLVGNGDTVRTAPDGTVINVIVIGV